MLGGKSRGLLLGLQGESRAGRVHVWGIERGATLSPVTVLASPFPPVAVMCKPRPTRDGSSARLESAATNSSPPTDDMSHRRTHTLSQPAGCFLPQNRTNDFGKALSVNAQVSVYLEHTFRVNISEICSATTLCRCFMRAETWSFPC